MPQPQRPHRKKNMTDEELRVWLLSQCEEQPAPYPELEGPCRIWARCTERRGYGNIKYHGSTVRAHRLVFRLTYGRWPTDHICHKCDRRACINLAHLFEGSNHDNVADMVQKQRQRGAAGEENGRAKVGKENVREIRVLADQGLAQTKIAALFDLSRTQVGNIVRRENWRHVD